MPAADGSNGQALTTNGSGTLSWATPAGGPGIVRFDFSSLAVDDGSTYKAAVAEVYDSAGVASVANTYEFTLAAGTYLIQWEPHGVYESNIGNGRNSNHRFTSVSGDANITGLGEYAFGQQTASEDSFMWFSTKGSFTLTQTSTYKFTCTFVNSVTFPRYLTLLKIS